MLKHDPLDQLQCSAALTVEVPGSVEQGKTSSKLGLCAHEICIRFKEATLLRAIPLLWHTFRGSLRKDITSQVPERLRSEALIERAARRWDERRSLTAALLAACGWDLVLGTIASATQGICASIIRPLILRRLILEVSTSTDSPTVGGWIALLGAVLIVEGLAAADRAYFGADCVGLGTLNALSGLAQRHCANVPTHIDGTQQIVNLVGTDATRILENQKGLMMFPLSVASVISGIIALLIMVGPIGLVGLIPMALLLCVNVIFAVKAKEAEHLNLTLSDERLQLMSQVVHGAKAIKLAAWEEEYMRVIEKARIAECIPLKQWRIYLQYTRQLGRANPIIASCTLFSVLAWVSPEVLSDAAVVFAAANVFLALRTPLICLPESMAYFASSKVAIERFEAFLRLPVAEKRQSPVMKVAEASCESNEVASVILQDAVFHWPQAATDSASEPSIVKQLLGLNLEIRKGQMVAVVGDVGSGKSTLLAALLGDLKLQSGCCEVMRDVGWVPQRAYVINGTIERNILMGRSGITESALKSAALADDVKRLGGLNAEIGERGVTLSGGQAQRLVLARAFLSDPKLLLADDPLSAIDSASSESVFEAIRTFSANGGTVVMALNQLKLLPYFHQVVILTGQSTPLVLDLSQPDVAVASLSDIEVPLVQAVGDALLGTAATELASKAEEHIEGGDETENGKGQLVEKDMESTGKMKIIILLNYIRGMGPILALGCLFLPVITYAAMGFTDRWLAVWTQASKAARDASLSIDHGVYAGVYIGSCAVFTFLLFLSSYAYAEGGVRSSKHLHRLCMERLMHAPLSWFESTPSGRILSRFSSDLSMVDQALAQWADNLAQLTCTLILLVTLSLMVVPACALPFCGTFLLFSALMRLVQGAGRTGKRWAIDGMSPVLTALSETYAGRQSLRTMGLLPLLQASLHSALDDHTRYYLAAQIPVDFGMLGSSCLAAVVGCTTAAFCYVNQKSYDPSFIALALTYSFLVPYFLSWYGDILNRVLVAITGLERLLHYADLEQEPSWHIAGEEELVGKHWPSGGSLTFQDVSLIYRPGLAPALKSISFHVTGGSSVGVVGRSGAGKSSVFGLMLRLRDPTSGCITVDGVDICKIGLQTLRRRLAVLPQEPLLFPGTCRENLDPFSHRSNEELQQALCAVGLQRLAGSLVETENSSISRDVSSSIDLSSLSTGEKQLLALARLLLRTEAESRIVLFDEPTSSVDAATDLMVQQALRERFARSTVLTIAHRLQTVLGANQILVFESGNLVEQGSPSDLLADPFSQLSVLAQKAGHCMSPSSTDSNHDSHGNVKAIKLQL